MRATLLDSLSRLAAHSGLGPLERLRALWPLLVSEPMAPRSRPWRLEGKRLIVAVESSAVAQDLSLQAGSVLRALRDRAADLGLPVPEQLVWRVAPDLLPQSRTRPPASKTAHAWVGPEPRVARPPSAELAGLLREVNDDELRRQLERLSALREPEESGVDVRPERAKNASIHAGMRPLEGPDR